MSKRVTNFCAGPCTLPLEVLTQAQAEFVDYRGTGMSLFEMSHRSREYDEIHNEALQLIRELYATPDDFEVLFVQGGASLQFAMVPMNLLGETDKAGYIDSGAWSSKAIADAQCHGQVYKAWDGEAQGYSRMPDTDEIQVEAGTRYLHVTSNETIGGIRMVDWPDLGVPLVADMSSDYLSRAIPWSRFGLIYGGAQKNLGPAGLGIVFVRRSALERCNTHQAAYLRYDVHASKSSLYNTPPVFPIYMMGKVLKWVRDGGGLAAMEQAAARRAEILYGAIDGSDGYYRCPVRERDRSHMNVVFRLPSEALEKQFVGEAGDADMVNLKGHRSVGGCRASLYNAMPESGVARLAQFMADFRARNGAA